jgi:hypothetical protein
MIIRRYINGKRVEDSSEVDVKKLEALKKVNEKQPIKPDSPTVTRRVEVRKSSSGCGCGK